MDTLAVVATNPVVVDTNPVAVVSSTSVQSVGINYIRRFQSISEVYFGFRAQYMMHFLLPETMLTLTTSRWIWWRYVLITHLTQDHTYTNVQLIKVAMVVVSNKGAAVAGTRVLVLT